MTIHVHYKPQDYRVQCLNTPKKPSDDSAITVDCTQIHFQISRGEGKKAVGRRGDVNRLVVEGEGQTGC